MCRIGLTLELQGPLVTYEPCLTPESPGCSLIAWLLEHFSVWAVPVTEVLLVSPSRLTAVGAESTSVMVTP